MMEGYLGEFPVDIANTDMAAFGPSDWALYCIERYGTIDGDHHKAWVLDQVARILHGTPVTVTEARWESGEKEYRMKLAEPSAEYVAWVEQIEDECGDYDA